MDRLFNAYAGTGAFWNATPRFLDGYKLLAVPETGINIDKVPGRGAGDVPGPVPAAVRDRPAGVTTQTEELLSPAGTEVLALVAEARQARAGAAGHRRRPAPRLPGRAGRGGHRPGRAAGGRRASSSRAARMLFTRPGLEQASSEIAARHRAARPPAAAPGCLADLGCGVGGDLIALAAGREVLAGGPRRGSPADGGPQRRRERRDRRADHP